MESPDDVKPEYTFDLTGSGTHYSGKMTGFKPDPLPCYHTHNVKKDNETNASGSVSITATKQTASGSVTAFTGTMHIDYSPVDSKGQCSAGSVSYTLKGTAASATKS